MLYQRCTTKTLKHTTNYGWAAPLQAACCAGPELSYLELLKFKKKKFSTLVSYISGVSITPTTSGPEWPILWKSRKVRKSLEIGCLHSIITKMKILRDCLNPMSNPKLRLKSSTKSTKP